LAERYNKIPCQLGRRDYSLNCLALIFKQCQAFALWSCNHYHRFCVFQRAFAVIVEVRNWSWFMAEVAASFARLCSSEAVRRLKTCQNPECGWFFLDESKSGNRKWCDETCATLMKVRRFRQKQKEND